MRPAFLTSSGETRPLVRTFTTGGGVKASFPLTLTLLFGAGRPPFWSTSQSGEAGVTPGSAASGSALAPAALAGDDAQPVARVDPVRVLDAGVEAPDLGPVPGVVEKLLREVPERVALDDDVLLGRAGHRLDVRVGRGAADAA